MPTPNSNLIKIVKLSENAGILEQKSTIATDRGHQYNMHVSNDGARLLTQDAPQSLQDQGASDWSGGGFNDWYNKLNSTSWDQPKSDLREFYNTTQNVYGYAATDNTNQAFAEQVVNSHSNSTIDISNNTITCLDKSDPIVSTPVIRLGPLSTSDQLSDVHGFMHREPLKSGSDYESAFEHVYNYSSVTDAQLDRWRLHVPAVGGGAVRSQFDRSSGLVIEAGSSTIGLEEHETAFDFSEERLGSRSTQSLPSDLMVLHNYHLKSDRDSVTAAGDGNISLADFEENTNKTGYDDGAAMLGEFSIARSRYCDPASNGGNTFLDFSVSLRLQSVTQSAGVPAMRDIYCYSTPFSTFGYGFHTSPDSSVGVGRSVSTKDMKFSKIQPAYMRFGGISLRSSTGDINRMDQVVLKSNEFMSSAGSSVGTNGLSYNDGDIIISIPELSTDKWYFLHVFSDVSKLTVAIDGEVVATREHETSSTSNRLYTVGDSASAAKYSKDPACLTPYISYSNTRSNVMGVTPSHGCPPVAAGRSLFARYPVENGYRNYDVLTQPLSLFTTNIAPRFNYTNVPDEIFLLKNLFPHSSDPNKLDSSTIALGLIPHFKTLTAATLGLSQRFATNSTAASAMNIWTGRDSMVLNKSEAWLLHADHDSITDYLSWDQPSYAFVSSNTSEKMLEHDPGKAGINSLLSVYANNWNGSLYTSSSSDTSYGQSRNYIHSTVDISTNTSISRMRRDSDDQMLYGISPTHLIIAPNRRYGQAVLMYRPNHKNQTVFYTPFCGHMHSFSLSRLDGRKIINSKEFAKAKHAHFSKMNDTRKKNNSFFATDSENLKDRVDLYGSQKPTQAGLWPTTDTNFTSNTAIEDYVNTGSDLSSNQAFHVEEAPVVGDRSGAYSYLSDAGGRNATQNYNSDLNDLIVAPFSDYKTATTDNIVTQGVRHDVFFSYKKTAFSSMYSVGVVGADNFGQAGVGSSEHALGDTGIYNSVTSVGKNNYGQLGDGSTSTT